MPDFCSATFCSVTKGFIIHPMSRLTASILIIEDNPDLATNIADYLESRGYVPDVAQDGVTGLHLAVSNRYDAMVLDLTLPGIDGLTLCRRLRQDAKSVMPVLMLTARGSLDDKEAGFAEGADDYLVKPFELRELDLRLQALLRRSSAAGRAQRLVVGDLVFDLGTLETSRAGRPVSLPAMPRRILELLMQRAPHVVPRTDIEMMLWGDSPPDSDALRVHMHTLRLGIEPPGTRPLLRTVRGVGYQLVDGDAEAA
jgi:DNA-binding response OmpR family regulator